MHVTLPDDVLARTGAAFAQPMAKDRSALAPVPPAARAAGAVRRRRPFLAGLRSTGAAPAKPRARRVPRSRSRAGHPRGRQFITNVSFDAHCMYVRLAPAHELALSLTQLPILQAAPPEERQRWQLIHHARAVRWPRLQLVIPLAALRRSVHRSDAACEQRDLR
jgi:hypothetical protein